MTEQFLGYQREDGSFGIRNKVLLLPLDRYSNQIAWQINNAVAGLTVLECPGDLGRHSRDRERLFRVMSGIGTNPNVHSVLLIGVKPAYNYPETRADRVAAAIEATSRRVETVMISDAGGMQRAVAEGQQIARALLWQASRQQRERAPLSALTIGIKCGISDGTSAISGNPALGSAMDSLLAAGGSVIFSETTEIIGAEHILAQRTSLPELRERLLAMVKRAEDLAAAVGEDIRSINPIPSNLKAGISTLEEKSLGALQKVGSNAALAGVLAHAEKPKRAGLHFMDGWMAGNSLLPALAAAGAQIVVFQSGGNDMPFDPPMPAINAGRVAPVYFMTGNPSLAANIPVGLDFDSSGVLAGEKTLPQIGAEILASLTAVASGGLTWGETSAYQENLEIWFDGPFF